MAQELQEMMLEVMKHPADAFRITSKTLQKLGWAEVRPWHEFTNGFEAPSNFEDR